MCWSLDEVRSGCQGATTLVQRIGAVVLQAASAGRDRGIPTQPTWV